jgi:N-acetylmuramoyl-L-alanine amidase
MTDYHAFRKISPMTQALIIEIGFLNLDRDLLTSGSETVVNGLFDGIQCYLENLN